MLLWEDDFCKVYMSFSLPFSIKFAMLWCLHFGNHSWFLLNRYKLVEFQSVRWILVYSIQFNSFIIRLEQQVFLGITYVHTFQTIVYNKNKQNESLKSYKNTNIYIYILKKENINAEKYFPFFIYFFFTFCMIFRYLF